MSFVVVPPQVPLVDAKGKITTPWWRFLQALYQAVLAGGVNVTLADLETLSFEGLRDSSGPDRDLQLANMTIANSGTHDSAGRVAALEQRVAELELLLADSATRRGEIRTGLTMTEAFVLGTH